MNKIQALETFCKFVLNENLMPTQVARTIKLSKKYRNSHSVIANLLLYRENAGAHVDADLVNNMDLGGFAYDDALVQWLGTMDGILHTIADDAGEHLFDNSDMVIASVKTFIKNCVLVADDIRDEYLTGPKTATRYYYDTLVVRDIRAQRQKEFEFYLAQNAYKSTTINAYKSAINTLSKEFKNIINNTYGLWGATNLTNLAEMTDKFTQTDAFHELDEKSHKTMSNALKRYTEFMQNRG